MKDFSTQETCEVMESVLFTSISEMQVQKSKVSGMMPILEHIAVDWNLDLKTQKGWDLTMKILKNSAKWN